MSLITKEWVLDNLISEIVFGVLFIGALALLWRYIRDFYSAVRITRIISIHNNPTRTWRKGIYARDRFMQLFESKDSMLSRKILVNGPGEGGGVWLENFVDEHILEYHGLVKLNNESNGIQVRANKDRVTNWVYTFSKWMENREKHVAERLIADKSGRFKRP